MKQLDEAIVILISEKQLEVADTGNKIQLFSHKLNSDEIKDLPEGVRKEVEYVRDLIAKVEGIEDKLPSNYDGNIEYSEEEGKGIYFVDAELSGGKEKVYIYDEQSASAYKVEATIIWGVEMHGYEYGELLVSQPGLLQKAQGKQEEEKLPVSITKIKITTTVTSITAIAEVENLYNGTLQYYWKESSQQDSQYQLVNKENITENGALIEGLTQETSYDVKVIADNGNGEPVELVKQGIIAQDMILPTNMTLSLTNANLLKEGMIKLTATFTPANVTNTEIEWKSSDDKIATVDEEGVVRGINPGEAIITATDAGGNESTCVVTVYSPIALYNVVESISGTSAREGGSITNIVDGNVKNLTNSTTSSYTVQAYSDTITIVFKESILLKDLYFYHYRAMDNNSSVSFTITGYDENGNSTSIGSGSYTSTGTNYLLVDVTDGYYKKLSIVCNSPKSWFWVSEIFTTEDSTDLILPTGISLSLSEAKLLKEGRVTLLADITPNYMVHQVVNWKSSDDKIATVDEEGVVRGINAGEAIITATDAGGNESTCVVTVYSPIALYNVVESISGTSAMHSGSRTNLVDGNVYRITDDSSSSYCAKGYSDTITVVFKETILLEDLFFYSHGALSNNSSASFTITGYDENGNSTSIGSGSYTPTGTNYLLVDIVDGYYKKMSITCNSPVSYFAHNEIFTTRYSYKQ